MDTACLSILPILLCPPSLPQGFAIITEPYDERLPQVADPVMQLSCLDASLAMRPVFSKYQTVVITRYERACPRPRPRPAPRHFLICPWMWVQRRGRLQAVVHQCGQPQPAYAPNSCAHEHGHPRKQWPRVASKLRRWPLASWLREMCACAAKRYLACVHGGGLVVAWPAQRHAEPH